MVKHIVFIVLLLFAAPAAIAQKFEIPQDYKFENEEDYQKYQPDVLKAIDWFQETPWNENRMKRNEIGLFLMEWIEGCPYVVVETSDDINDLGNNNYDLLIAYLGGYTKYLLDHPEISFKNEARMAGMKALFSKYQKDKIFTPDKKIEELMQLNEQGLQRWLSQELD